MLVKAAQVLLWLSGRAVCVLLTFNVRSSSSLASLQSKRTSTVYNGVIYVARQRLVKCGSACMYHVMTSYHDRPPAAPECLNSQRQGILVRVQVPG